MYTKQHGLEANLFLAPGEGGDAEPEKPAPTPTAPTSGLRLLGE